MTEAEGRALVGLLRACKPAFREGRKADRLAFALNAYFLCKGYKLVAVGEDADGLDKVVDKTEEVDVDGWNKEETDYCFAYIPEGEDQVRVLVLCVYLGSKLCMQALSKNIGEDKKLEREPVSLEMGVEAFIQDPSGGGGGDVKSAFKDLNGMVKQFSKFECAIKAQLSDDESATKKIKTTTKNEGEHVTIPATRPPGNGGSGSAPPDPLRIIDPRPLGVYRPAVPLIGADDLVPPGVRPPGMPFEPSMPFGVGGPLRGSHVGPSDPIFGQRGGRISDPSLDMNRSRLPPGARFDPINPPGMPGSHPDDFIQDPDGQQRFGGGGGRVHPDIGGPPEGGGNNGMDYMFG
jgi:proteasome inhibitor subunit 1 (PI31)